jgi:hypothetical protein
LSAVASVASVSHHEEAFYVLKGELTVRLGPQKLYTLVLTLDTVVASGYRPWHHNCGVGSSLQLMRGKGVSKYLKGIIGECHHHDASN